MPDTVVPHETYPKLVTKVLERDQKTDPVDFCLRVGLMLDEIDRLPLGKALLTEIQEAGHEVKIQPALAQSNQTAAANHHCFVKLRQAFNGDGAHLAHEMKAALNRLRGGGRSVEALAKQIMGMRPVTRRTSQNIGMAPREGFKQRVYKMQGKLGRRELRPVYSAPGVAQTQAANLGVEGIVDLLHGIEAGRVDKRKISGFFRGESLNQRPLEDDIMRALYVPHPSPLLCNPGDGCAATIHIDAEARASCWYDKTVERPPIIGFIHELIHAWRNVKGLRYFSDMQKTKTTGKADDEVMTTGFPPYHNEMFSENVFRGLMQVEVNLEGLKPGAPRSDY